VPSRKEPASEIMVGGAAQLYVTWLHVGELDAQLAKYLMKVKIGGPGNTSKPSTSYLMSLSTAQSMPSKMKLCTNSFGFALVRITLPV
jgi:hypothetical protein